MMLSDQDYERLSAYVDGELSATERAALESRLATEAELRAELEALRATVNLLAALPARRAPRDFTLDARSARRPPARVLFMPAAAFSALSAAAATVLIALSAVLFSGSRLAAPLAQSVALGPTTPAGLTATASGSMERSAESTTAPPAAVALTQSPTAGSGLADTFSAEPPNPANADIMPAATGLALESAAAALPEAQATTELENAAPIAAGTLDGSDAMLFAAPVSSPDASLMQPGQPADAAAAGMSAAAPANEQMLKTDVSPSTTPAMTQTAVPSASPLPTRAPPTATPPPTTTPAPTAVPAAAAAVDGGSNTTLPALLLGLGLALLAVSIGVYVRTRGR